MILQVYVPDDAARRLREIADELGRTMEDLAESAVSESVCDYDRQKQTRQRSLI